MINTKRLLKDAFKLVSEIQIEVESSIETPAAVMFSRIESALKTPGIEDRFGEKYWDTVTVSDFIDDFEEHGLESTLKKMGVADHVKHFLLHGGYL